MTVLRRTSYFFPPSQCFPMLKLARKQSLNLHSFLPSQAIDQRDWGDQRCAYRIFYRLKAPKATWRNKTVSFCSTSWYSFTGLLSNSEYEIAIQAGNGVGPGPSSPIVRVLSGQTPPKAPPYLTIIRVDANSVEVQWSAINVLPPKSVDGYWVSMESRDAER